MKAMDGPSHFRRAEQLLYQSEEAGPDFAPLYVAQAAVHAQLADTASRFAIGLNRYSEPSKEWQEVLGVSRQA